MYSANFRIKFVFNRYLEQNDLILVLNPNKQNSANVC